MEKEFVARFFREARSAASLKHPNIVTIHDVGEENNTYYFAMEYLEGGSLEDRIERLGPLPLEEADAVILQLADALDFAHKKGIIHRDIKPGNVIIDEDGRAVLTDFGIAKAAFEQKLTKTGMTIGSPEYMPPEQVKGHEIDGRADYYSLGVMYYQMLSGCVPYSGDTAVSIAYQHVNEPIPSLADLRPELPAYVDGIVQKLMAKDPNERIQTGGELIQALKAKEVPAAPYYEGNDFQAEPPQANEQPVVPPPVYEPAPSPPVAGYNPQYEEAQYYEDRPPRTGGKRKLIFGLGAILCILAVVIIGVLLLSPEKPPYGAVGSGGGGGPLPIQKPTLDRNNPQSVANAMLAAFKNADVEAIKLLLSDRERTGLEEARQNNPVDLQERLRGIQHHAERCDQIRQSETESGHRYHLCPYSGKCRGADISISASNR